jgi:hypothetical protein
MNSVRNHRQELEIWSSLRKYIPFHASFPRRVILGDGFFIVFRLMYQMGLVECHGGMVFKYFFINSVLKSSLH